MKNQKFGQGDIAMLEGKFKVKIVMPIQDEDGSWWYEVEAIDFEAPFNREVPQSALSQI